MSHPLRVRELKPVTVICADTRIQSHPLRVRELKHVDSTGRAEVFLSHPLRVRELKQKKWLILNVKCIVAPFTGA